MDIPIYCLIVATAYPDYKLPSVNIQVSHYIWLADAQAEAQSAVQKYVYDSHNLCAKAWNNGELSEFVYKDSVLQNKPIKVNLFELECWSPGVLKREEIEITIKLDENTCPCSDCRLGQTSPPPAHALHT